MSKSKSRKLKMNLSVRFSVEEKRTLECVARAHGMGPSTFVRRKILRSVHLPLPAVKVRETELARSIALYAGQLGRVGNLLNQLARAANRGGVVDRQSLDSLRVEVERLTVTLLALKGGQE